MWRARTEDGGVTVYSSVFLSRSEDYLLYASVQEKEGRSSTWFNPLLLVLGCLSPTLGYYGDSRNKNDLLALRIFSISFFYYYYYISYCHSH